MIGRPIRIFASLFACANFLPSPPTLPTLSAVCAALVDTLLVVPTRIDDAAGMDEIFLCRAGIPEIDVFPVACASRASSDGLRVILDVVGGMRVAMEEMRVEEDCCGVARGASWIEDRFALSSCGAGAGLILLRRRGVEMGTRGPPEFVAGFATLSLEVAITA